MKKTILLLLMFGILLNLNTLDNIYVGVYQYDENGQMEKRVSEITIKPESLDYYLDIELEDNQRGFYMYNLGFGEIHS